MNDITPYDTLYERLKPLSQYHSQHNWGRVAHQYNIDTLRVVTPLDVQDFDNTYVINFVKGYGPSIVFPITFSKILFGYGLRALNTKAFTVITKSPLYVYASSQTNARMLKSDRFPFGVPFALSEGVMDSEFISFITPVSLAYLTAYITDIQAQFISMYTNRVIIITDNDDAGERGYRKSKSTFDSHGVSVKRLMVPKQYGDPGDIIYDLTIPEKKESAARCFEQLSVQIKHL